MTILVDCYYCNCPVHFDPSGKLAALGITVETCEEHNLAVICSLCTDMMEVEGVEVEIVNENELKKRIEKEAA
jgi:hypothetical protein